MDPDSAPGQGSRSCRTWRSRDERAGATVKRRRLRGPHVAQPAAGAPSAGPTVFDDAATRHRQRAVAEWVVGFLAPGYGPGGGVKLVDDGVQASWVRSAAAALSQAPTHEPMLAPYRDLARRIQTAAGDQSTLATLFAARLVVQMLDAPGPPAAWRDGLPAVRRQTLATLEALRSTAEAENTLAGVAGRDAARTVVAGLRDLRKASNRRDPGDGRGDPRDLRWSVDLNDIDVRADEPDAGTKRNAVDDDVVRWLPGVLAKATARHDLDHGQGGVLLLDAAWTLRPRAEGLALHVRNAKDLDAAHAWETVQRERALARLRELDVGFVACASALPETLADAMRAAGLVLWTECPRSALSRLERATGARRVAHPEQATPDDIGHATWERRHKANPRWTVQGQGASATLLMPATTPSARAAAIEGGERLLRAAGLALAEPGVVPGGGRWQRHLATALRKAAPLAPSRGPLVFDAAARAFDALADDLVRNQGRDPLAVRLLEDAEDVLDAAAGTRLSVQGAFEVVGAVLRLDGVHAKRASSTTALRGGGGRVGSARGMPGDIPPLM